MNPLKSKIAPGIKYHAALGVAVLAVLTATGRPAVAQAVSTGVAPLISPAVGEGRDGSPSGIVPAGCTSCSLPPLGPDSDLGGFGKRIGTAAHCDLGCAGAGCGEAGCVAGRPGCETCEGRTGVGRLFCDFHNAVCCPDPCYEPRWVPAANAALFVPSVRPATYTRYRWDYGNNLTTPDRAEYFWAAIGGKGPPNPETSVDYHELSLYAEFGTQKFSFFVDTPYRNVRPERNAGAGSFGDLTVGTKSVLLDSEVLLTTFQFKTIIPTGNAGRGTGTGHVSLEPSLLWTVKLHPDVYWQSQLGYWIPLGFTDKFSGGVVTYNNSINAVLCRPLRDTALIGTIESTGYTFTAGRFTDAAGVVQSAQTTYFNLGPGLRLSICDKLDIGFGMQFALTTDHFAEQLYRTELRWRF